MDNELLNLTRTMDEQRRAERANVKATTLQLRGPRRGPGRPRKEPLVFHDPEPEYSSSDPDEEQADNFEETLQEADAEKIELVAMITELQVKLKARGTNMKANTDIPLHALRNEFNLLNNEINSRRAETFVKHIALEVIIPAIEKAAPYVIPQDQVDVTGMAKEARDDYDEVFKDTLTHISILNRHYFALGPYGEFINGIIKVGTKAATKNELRKKISAQAAANGDPDEDIEDK